jgi:N,N'-diacetyllegionaminate synthase
MEVGIRTIGPREPVLVIAEIGNNHDGSVRQAERLIDAAAEAGADAVKFQTHIAAAEMLPSTPTPPHFDEPRYAFTKRMELSLDDHRRLRAFAEARGLIFFSSPFSVEAVVLLENVGVLLYKVASGEVTNPPLLEAIAATGKPVMLSTGMSGVDDVAAAVAIFLDRAPLVLMQCTSAYPCPPERVNLRAMVALAEQFGVPVGLSDHTADIVTSIAAVALGAVCVEKHFTLSKRLYGPDHHASLEPDELRRLVDGVRQVEAALGSPEKERDPSLEPVRATFEKSVVTATAIAAGTTIEAAMLTTKRPGSGIPATRLAELVGRRAARDLPANELVQVGDVEYA